MDCKVAAIILAAGSGKRMIDKQKNRAILMASPGVSKDGDD